MEEENKKTQDMTILFTNGEDIEFKNINGHRIGETWVAVMVGENTHVFRSDEIREMNVTIKE